MRHSRPKIWMEVLLQLSLGLISCQHLRSAKVLRRWGLGFKSHKTEETCDHTHISGIKVMWFISLSPGGISVFAVKTRRTH